MNYRTKCGFFLYAKNNVFSPQVNNLAINMKLIIISLNHHLKLEPLNSVFSHTCEYVFMVSYLHNVHASLLSYIIMFV